MFNVQKISSCKQDWVLTVNEDLKICNIDKSESEIKEMTKYAFKKLISDRIKKVSLEYLLKLKSEHSKTKHVWPTSDIKSYLTISELSVTDKQLLFSLRCRMNETRCNYKAKYNNDLHCTLCTVVVRL